MANITIGAAAGKYDIDVSDLGLDSLTNRYTDRTLHIKGGKGSIEFEAGKGQTLTAEGKFNLVAVLDKNIVKAVTLINNVELTKGHATIFSITDLGLTGTDLKTDKTFANFLNSEDYTINGNSANNTLVSGAGNDKLYGNGGNDMLEGGLGNDKLFGGAGNDDLIGGTGNDTLTGDAGNDMLDGGAGKNVLIGGDGNDTYWIGAGDKIVEGNGKNGGFDTVVASANIDLSKLDNVEGAMLDGKGNFKLVGNALNNVLEGNDGKNVLDGGKGADRLVGGNGDDTYVVDNAKDVIVESGKKDHDSIQASVSIDLSKLKLIEDVFLFGKQDLNATGNGLNNVLKGNDGDNTLWGAGGNDTLTGGKGSDTFEFHKGDKSDTITDFDAAGRDHDVLDLQGFGKKFNFNAVTIEKVGKSDIEVNFGHGDTLHVHLVNSAIKDIDASDFQF
jgi:Ca2+-binding RTX toxin-like protein